MCLPLPYPRATSLFICTIVLESNRVDQSIDIQLLCFPLVYFRPPFFYLLFSHASFWVFIFYSSLLDYRVSNISLSLFTLLNLLLSFLPSSVISFTIAQSATIFFTYSVFYPLSLSLFFALHPSFSSLLLYCFLLFFPILFSYLFLLFRCLLSSTSSF